MSFIQISCPRCSSHRAERTDTTHYRCGHCGALFLREHDAVLEGRAAIPNPPVVTRFSGVGVAPPSNVRAPRGALRMFVVLGAVTMVGMGTAMTLFVGKPRVVEHQVVSAPTTVAVEETAYPLEERVPSLSLSSPEVRAGEKFEVDFSFPLDAAGGRHWITLVPAGAVDSEWGQWQYVDVGAASATIEAKSSGPFQVRLHSRYPAMSTHVVARLDVTVKARGRR